MPHFSSPEHRRQYYACNPELLRLERIRKAESIARFRERYPEWDRLPKNRLTRLVHKGVQARGFKALRPVTELLGCPVLKAVEHIESQFRDGMTWQNWGRVWELDHIRPLSSFDLGTLKGQKAAQHYTNWQPLLIAEHRAKTARERKR